MNKAGIIASVKETTGFTKKDSAIAVDAVFGAIQAGLVNDGSVGVVGFGTMSVKDRDARTGRNPQTGEAIEIAAHKAVAFKASPALKELVNG